MFEIQRAFRLCVLALLLGAAMQAPVSASPPKSEEAELIALDQALLEATLKKDRARLEEIYDDSFILLDPESGEVIGKKQNIDEICSPSFRLGRLEGSNYQVQIFGNAATVTHDAHITVGGSEPYEGTSKALHHFVKRDGRWRVLFTLDR